MWPWRVKMATQNLLRLLLLLILMVRIVSATVCCRFGSWGLVINVNFCSEFEHKAWSRSWSWSSGKILSWSLVSILLLMFCRGYELESWSRFEIWSWWLVDIMKMKFDHDLCLNLVKWTRPSGPLCLWQGFLFACTTYQLYCQENILFV